MRIMRIALCTWDVRGLDFWVSRTLRVRKISERPYIRCACQQVAGEKAAGQFNSWPFGLRNFVMVLVARLARGLVHFELRHFVTLVLKVRGILVFRTEWWS